MSCRPNCDKHVHSPSALAAYFRNRLHRNQHAVWASVGPPGSGKSEGNLMLGMDIQGSPIDVRRQVAFKPTDRKKLAQSLPRFKVVLDDEATGEGGHRRRAMSTANVDNVQDLDACRGRNQANGFAAPALTSLDQLIQDHLMGFLQWSADHSCEWFEAIRGGPAWAPTVYWETRFTVPGDKMPSLEEHFPEVRKEYLAAKEDHMHGRSTTATDRVLLEDKFYALLSKPLQPRVPQKVAAEFPGNS